jgi:glycosyltransferase involved in cell wall biosynthesis
MHLLASLSRHFDVTLLTHAAQVGYEAHLPRLQLICRRVLPLVPVNKRSALHRFAYKTLFWTRALLQGESSDRFYNTVPNVARAVERELEENRYDVVYCMYWYWPAAVSRASGLRVLDSNDVQTERYRNELEHTGQPLLRLMRRRLLRKYERQERSALQSMHLVVAVTERDRELLARMAVGTEVVVVPTGLDTEHFSPRETTAEAGHLVFYGAMANPMNRDAVHHFVREILPRIRARGLDVRVSVVGSSPASDIVALGERDPQIEVTGFVDDVREPLASATLVVCPLRFASGIRGRLYEVMSLAVPVVATPVAVRGMGLRDGDGVVVAESPEPFAAAVARLLQDANERARLGARGRALAEERMSIAATFGRLADDLIRRVRHRGEETPGREVL